MDDAQSNFGLVMPFVSCVSNGGTHADAPFVAGYECGYIFALLETRPERVERYVHPSNVKQLDLTAMHHGYSASFTPWEDHPDEWTLMVLERVKVSA